MCRPTHFAVTYRINPWMDPDGAVRQRAGRQPVGEPAADLPRPRPHRRADRRRCPACPTWSSPPTAPPWSTARCWPCSSATPSGPTRPRRTRPGSESAGFEVHRPEAHQRGRGRHPARRRRAAGRHRLPHRARRARGDPGGLRPPGDHPAAGRPGVLPPGHRALRARRARTSRTCRRRSRPARRPCCGGSSRTRSSPPPADAEVLGLNAVSDGRTVVLPVQATAPDRGAAGRAATRPSGSTCPSCARPAADRSAARWRSS